LTNYYMDLVYLKVGPILIRS